MLINSLPQTSFLGNQNPSRTSNSPSHHSSVHHGHGKPQSMPIPIKIKINVLKTLNCAHWSNKIGSVVNSSVSVNFG